MTRIEEDYADKMTSIYQILRSPKWLLIPLKGKMETVAVPFFHHR